MSADTDTYRQSRNRNGGDWYDTDPRIIFATTHFDSIDIGRFESVMHDIDQYIRVNSKLTRIFFQIVPVGKENMDELSKGGSGILEALNTRVYGNATNTLVLSHGFGVDQTVWQFIIPVLACYFKVVVYDLVFSPNVSPKLYDPKRYSHNFSAYAEDLICILDQLHVKETVFIGHSMSAMIGCIAATKRPQLFQHLILLNGSPRYLDAQHYEGGFSEQDLNAILTNLQRNFSAWARDLAPRAIGVNNSEAIAKFEGSLARMKPEIALDVAKTVFLGDNRRFLQHVRMRSTIIQPEKDIFVPLSVPRYMKKKLHAQLITLGISGHFPQLTAYALLLRVIKNLLLLNSN